LTRSRWTALALLAVSLASLAGCGGGSSTGNSNPTPMVATVFPGIITAGSQGFTLFVTGTNFQSGSTGASFVFWNGIPLSTVLNASTTQLQASVPASFVVNPNVVQITVANPAPGGGVSNAVSFTIEPLQIGAPAISTISPSSAASGASAFTLTVNGSNFTTNDVVTWNGEFRTTTFVSSIKLTAQILNTDVASAGIASVTVLDTVSGIIEAPSVQFMITGAANPTPSISSLSPSTALEGGPDFELLIKGSNFVSNSIACFNNSPLGTAFITASQLGAWIPAADIASGGVATISVTNSGFCGVNPASASVNLSINNPVPTIVGLSPSTITAGSQNFTLVVSGSNFIVPPNGITFAFWNGSLRSTIYNPNTQQLDVLILASDVATAGTAQITLENPAPGGGTSTPVSFTIAAPQAGGPVISSLVPSNTAAGNPSFTLTVNGSNFVSTDAITWNGQPQITAFVNASKLTTQINGALIASPGFASVAVMPTSGASSPALDFTITGPANLAPTLAVTSPVTPVSASAGGPAFELIINGSNFAQNSSVMWNATSLVTSFVNSTQLIAWVPASLITSTGSVNVTVFNPAPGGGTSQIFVFTIH
jgi:hypothetical protein